MSAMTISEARDHIPALLEAAGDDDVTLLRHGRPVAVVMSHERHEALLEELDDLRDTIAAMDSLDEPGTPLGEVRERLADIP